MDVKRISVIGLGYIGLPTAAVFASRKLEVIGVDVNADTVATINRGEVHIVEPELDGMVRAAVAGRHLRATTTPEPADAFLIAVPTPFKDGHEPDLRYIEAASRSIAPVLEKGNLVILESTSPVGATEQMAAWLAEARPDLHFPHGGGNDADIRIAYCPERVLPGNVIHELVHNDRVIGGLSPRCSQAAIDVYRIFLAGECFVTNARTAELCKLAENSFRDVNIAFANELSLVGHRLGVDVWELISLANRHPRVNILQPGPGVGGHCIAVDPWFIVSSCPAETQLIRAARAVNDEMPEWILGQVDRAVERFLAMHPARTVRDVCIACFGLTFKANIDDMRESPALDITHRLGRRHGGAVIAVEPNVAHLPQQLLACGVQKSGVEEALDDADVLVMLVDHDEFRAVGSERFAGKTIIDAKGLWTKQIGNCRSGQDGP